MSAEPPPSDPYAAAAALGLRTAGLFHDLRSAFNVVGGCAELMARSDDRGERVEYLEEVWRQLDAVTAMANEVMAFARGEQTVFPRKVYMNRFLDQMAGTLHDKLAGSGIALRFDAQYLGVAWFDEPKILRVIDNLVRNATEAMSGAGDLRISTRADEGSLYLELADTGPGIPEDVAPRLFEPFVTSKHTGTGLGLSICKTIVTEHAGEISFHSGRDQGTTFVVRLPLSGTGHPPSG
ncbi:MAG TPA: HAMP domain-containing sensor histidine kinase [Kofleriaceae bacterium]|nr:HAMP domain-containing sensor histidine kinase [Kofleriaceae bacterium]